MRALAGAMRARVGAIVNTHVHLPPNFSAFDTPAQAVQLAAREGVRALGASNYHHFGVYASLRDEAARAGVIPLFGIEIITLVEGLQRDGVLVNDPVNPGRMYLCGKGITRFDPPSGAAAGLLAGMRVASDERMREMAERLRQCFAAAGLSTGLTEATIADEVARLAGVPRPWVSLQERHLARAFQQALFGQVAPDERRDVLGRAFGTRSTAEADDPIAVQDEIRSHLMKAGRPAFVPEAAITFEAAYRLILQLGGIPCYPTLADGTTPICEFEDPPDALARKVLERGIYCAELIPRRNRPDVVDRYVQAYRRAGVIVVSGTEHNTPHLIPLEPRCRDGASLSEAATEAFWEGACVVTAHQHLGLAGRPGYVDGEGTPAAGFESDEARVRHFAQYGSALILGDPGRAAAPSDSAATVVR
jgi:hypothetical protein